MENNPLFFVVVFVFVICMVGILFGRGKLATSESFRTQGANRLQSVSLIGLGLSAGAMGLLLAETSTLALLVFLVGGILILVAGFISLIKKSN